MKKIIIRNLPAEATEATVRALFTQFGTVRAIKIQADLFTGKCRGIGFIEMEGHEAREAIAGLDGRTWEGKFLKVHFDDKKRHPRTGGRR